MCVGGVGTLERQAIIEKAACSPGEETVTGGSVQNCRHYYTAQGPCCNKDRVAQLLGTSKLAVKMHPGWSPAASTKYHPVPRAILGEACIQGGLIRTASSKYPVPLSSVKIASRVVFYGINNLKYPITNTRYQSPR